MRFGITIKRTYLILPQIKKNEVYEMVSDSYEEFVADDAKKQEAAIFSEFKIFY